MHSGGLRVFKKVKASIDFTVVSVDLTVDQDPIELPSNYNQKANIYIESIKVKFVVLKIHHYQTPISIPNFLKFRKLKKGYSEKTGMS